MRKLIRIAALAALTVVGVAQANAAVSTLAECYDLVIADCNKGNHAQSCASSGMDQCDKVFPTPMIIKPGLVFSPQVPQERAPTVQDVITSVGIAVR